MQPPPGVDAPLMDTAEIVYISSLALLKVRKMIQSWYTMMYMHALHVYIYVYMYSYLFPFNPCMYVTHIMHCLVFYQMLKHGEFHLV